MDREGRQAAHEPVRRAQEQRATQSARLASSMHVMAAMQLMKEAGDMQIPDAKLAGVFNMGGAAVANYVSILERQK